MTDEKDVIPMPDQSAETSATAKARPDDGDDKPSTADLVRQAKGETGDRGKNGDGYGKVAETTVRGPAPGEVHGGPRHGETTTAQIAESAKADERKAETHDDEETAPLFSGDEAGKLKARWDAIQVGFVDEPRKAVEDADALVASTMQRLAEMFSEERSKLEGQWDRGDDVSTEDLRVALRRYRTFFERLLST